MIFNAKSASIALQTVSDTLTVIGAAITDSTNRESGEISEVGYVFDKDGKRNLVMGVHNDLVGGAR